ncbi:MarR family winged helix-turn-helix transcriptional regulator [Roseicella aquatilis]|uniref:MarR family winged helix-turn-helix transcriptional regulator n=1 Tax=Roseicella aquatilis TaxID=2527868 RepID=UPI001404B211|nr:MarR family transcriptional regulator [Roseicella aquatilis]
MAQEHRFTAEEILDRFAAHWPEAGGRWTVSLMVPLYRLHDLAMARMDAVLRPLGLSTTAFDVLTALRCTPPPHELRPTEIAEALLLSSGGLTKVLHGLARAGLVERPGRGEADRRCRPARLTEAGRALVERAMEQVVATEAALLGRATTPDAAEPLAAGLRRLVAIMEAAAVEEERAR